MYKVIILGKLPPPYFGPAVATKIILESDLRNYFDLEHFNTALNDTIEKLGKINFSKLFYMIIQYYNYLKKIIILKPELTLVPISQTTIGFFKDSVYIILSKVVHSKVIIHLRGSNFRRWLDNKNILVRALAIFIVKQCDGAIVLGENLKYIFYGLLPEENIYVVPNGADYSFPEVQKENTILKITYIGNFLESKGIDSILKSLIKIKQSDKKLIFNAYGKWADKEYKSYCKALMEQISIEVKLNDSITGDSKLKILKNSDIFIFTPKEPEGHPWVIVEALAAGLPIISADQGAITESVHNKVNGFIVDPINITQITSRLQYLIDNEAERIIMANQSREIYLKYFTQKIMVDKLKTVFETVINKH